MYTIRNMSTNIPPLLELHQLQGNEPTTLNALQTALSPHLTTIIALWWVVWMGVLVFMITSYIIKPILKNYLKNNYEHLTKKNN